MVASAAGGYFVLLPGDTEVEGRAVARVKRGPLVISVKLPGTIQNRERLVLKNEVEGNASILYLIPEGLEGRPEDVEADPEVGDRCRREGDRTSRSTSATIIPSGSPSSLLRLRRSSAHGAPPLACALDGARSLGARDRR